jgi:uncharacterized protein YegP (UPF0339 family)
MSFEIYKDASGEWRWRLKALNGQIIATSGEGYRNSADAKKAIELVRQSGSASIEENIKN